MSVFLLWPDAPDSDAMAFGVGDELEMLFKNASQGEVVQVGVDVFIDPFVRGGGFGY